MVLRFASQKLLNLYFKCLILHLVKYIQRNKQSKEKQTAFLFCVLSHDDQGGVKFGSRMSVSNASTWVTSDMCDIMSDNSFTYILLIRHFPQETQWKNWTSKYLDREILISYFCKKNHVHVLPVVVWLANNNLYILYSIYNSNHYLL